VCVIRSSSSITKARSWIAKSVALSETEVRRGAAVSASEPRLDQKRAASYA
jgi:hypothetical protein